MNSNDNNDLDSYHAMDPSPRACRMIFGDKQQITCPCGSTYRIQSYTGHHRSAKHSLWIANLEGRSTSSKIVRNKVLDKVNATDLITSPDDDKDVEDEDKDTMVRCPCGGYTEKISLQSHSNSIMHCFFLRTGVPLSALYTILEEVRRDRSVDLSTVGPLQQKAYRLVTAEINRIEADKRNNKDKDKDKGKDITYNKSYLTEKARVELLTSRLGRLDKLMEKKTRKYESDLAKSNTQYHLCKKDLKDTTRQLKASNKDNETLTLKVDKMKHQLVELRERVKVLSRLRERFVPQLPQLTQLNEVPKEVPKEAPDESPDEAPDEAPDEEEAPVKKVVRKRTVPKSR